MLGWFTTFSIESAVTDMSEPLRSGTESMVNVPPAISSVAPFSGFTASVICSSPPSTLTALVSSMVCAVPVIFRIPSPALANVAEFARSRFTAVPAPSNVPTPLTAMSASVPRTVWSLPPSPSVVGPSLVKLLVMSVPLMRIAPGEAMVVVSNISSVAPEATVADPPVTSSDRAPRSAATVIAPDSTIAASPLVPMGPSVGNSGVITPASSSIQWESGAWVVTSPQSPV